VQPAPQPVPDRPQPRLHPVASCLPPQQKTTMPAAPADVGEPQEVERLRLSLPTLLSIRSDETPEFNQACFIRM